ncbi:response regulator [bacterium]|nr:response regulator [bacterium]
MADEIKIPKKILFADFAIIKFNQLMDQLRKEGFGVDGVTDEKKFVQKISEEAVDICVINLLLGGTGPFELIRKVRASSRNRDVKVIVISKQVQKLNIQNTLKAGANDFVADPVDNDNLHARILYHLTPKRVIENLTGNLASVSADTWPVLSTMLNATERLSRTPPLRISDAFHGILCDVAKLLESNRTSMMIVDEENNSGVVLASSDDPKFCDFPVVLNKYPEVLDVIHSGNFVLIDDVSKNQLTQQINENVRSIAIGSIMVFPVRYAGEVVGVLTVRRPKASDLPSLDNLRVLQALANTLAAHANMKASLRRIYRDYKPTKAG